jgi:hypothetical protein
LPPHRLSISPLRPFAAGRPSDRVAEIPLKKSAEGAIDLAADPR